jgi:glutamine amidotransferase
VKITVIDSPVANVPNIVRALRACGGDPELTRDPVVIASSSRLVLPGVGSFRAAREFLATSRIDEALHVAVARGATLLGICVGHQLLFDSSSEMGDTRGLGLVRGEVTRLDGPLPVPQIGWNRVSGKGPLFEGVREAAFYFVNSFSARGAECEAAVANYNGPFTAAVQRDRVFGVQFHPEKSSTAGLRVLRNYIEWN